MERDIVQKRSNLSYFDSYKGWSLVFGSKEKTG